MYDTGCLRIEWPPLPSEVVKKPTVLWISRSGGARNPHVFQHTLRFLRSGGTRPSFARDGFFTTSQGLNGMGSGIGGGSGQLESIEGPRRCSGRCPGGPAQMREDLGDHGRIFDGGDDRQGATTLGALFQVDTETRLSSRGQRIGAEGGGAASVRLSPASSTESFRHF